MQYKSQKPDLIFSSINKKTPLLSILIPTFKRIKLLENAIISAIKQDTTINYEIIIVDNDQSKKSLYLIKKICDKFPNAQIILYQQSENIGLNGNWNSCLRLGNAKWMTILSDDDLLKPNWLSLMWKVKNYLRDPILIACNLEFNEKKYSQYDFFKNVITFYENTIYSNIKIRNLSILDYFIEMPHQGVLGAIFDRKKVIDCGGFDLNCHATDYKLLCKLATFKKSYLIKNKLAIYLRTGENTSADTEWVYKVLEENVQLQKELIPQLPAQYKFLYKWYVKLFLTRSLSGQRKYLRLNKKIKSFISTNNLNFRFNNLFYFSLKIILQILARIHRLRISNAL